MNFLINPNIAYLFIVAAITLFLMTIIFPKSIIAKVGMALCLGVAGYELVHLRGNPWAFLAVALSPLPFFIAIRQTRVNLPLLFITFLMLTIGSFFLLVDQKGHPVISYGLAGIVSAYLASIIWITIRRMQKVQGIRLSDNPDSMVGFIGKARTEIELHSTGSVEVEGEIWTARSDKYIPAGSTVRILGCDSLVLTVKKVEKITKE
jgi:membrane-bound serine protease (ClpP class)